RINISPEELKKMIADYMEKGFLENIIDMFKHDSSLYSLVGELMTDERVRVRLGMSALVETLGKENPEHIKKAVPGILPLLKNPEPVIRGDAAYLLGIIGHSDSIPLLKEAAEDDENPDVRLIAKEAIEDIKTCASRP
ncbi:MAG: HEAT repeat domain-containing protein, partial [Thermodesulfovibrionales bacterium]|nr:HEAT repeat domain-containing protein [Thermodesulfovibrionales bacterium]